MIVTTLALKYTWLLVVITYITCTSVHATTCLPDAVITEHPSTVVAALNSSVSFTCSGYRYIIWKVNNIQIKSNEAQTAASARGIFANIDDQNSSQLFMFASLINNNTKIQCFVRVNQLATNCLSSRIARLYVYGSPHPPSNLTISQLGFDLSLSWEATFSLKGENITYIVRVTNTRSRESREIESDLPQLVLSESIGERDCSLYEFRVYSVNPVGRSTTSIHDTVRIPTEPLVLQSVDVFVDVSLEKGVSVTLSFNAPKPCSSYQVISYNVTFTDRIKSVPSLNSSASDSFFITEYWNNFDFVVLTVDNQTTSIKKDKAYLVAIEARNIAGSMISEPVKVYTTGLQSSSVVLEVNDTASVTCNFAFGSDALGCEVSFYVSTSMELLFVQNITREPSSGNTLTKNIPLMGSLNGSTANITVLTSEWLADGSVSLVEIEAEVEIIEPITTTLDVSTVPTSDTTDTSSTTRPSLGSPTNPVITTVVLIVSLRLRKQKAAAVEIRDHVLEPNVAYGVLNKSKRQRNQPQNGINVTRGEPTVQEMVPNTAYGVVLVAEETIQGNETPPPIPPKSHNNVGVASYEDIDAAIGRSPAYEEIKNSLHTPAASLGGSPLYEEIKAKTKGPSLSEVYDDVVLK